MPLTPEEEFELLELERERASAGQITPTGQPDSDMLQSAIAHAGKQAAERSQRDTFSDTLVDYGIRVMDYPGGILRTAIETPMALAMGKITPQTAKEDVSKTIRGQSPMFSERLERAGMQPGLLTGVAGFVADVATDPGGSVLKAMSRGGKSIFKGGLKNIDKAVEAFGKKPPSEVLLEHGVKGPVTNKGLLKRSGKIAADLGQTKQGILIEADRAGGAVNFGKSIEDMDQLVASKLTSKDPAVRNAAEKTKELIDEYRNIGITTLSEADAIKTNLYKRIQQKFGKNVWAAQREGTIDADILKGVSGAVKSSIEQGVERATGKGGVLKQVNNDLGSLLTARKAVGKAVEKEAKEGGLKGLLLPTQIDAMVFASGHPELVIAKKAAQAGRMQAVRTATQTGLGSAMMKLGETGQKIGPVERRILINLFNREE